MEPVVDPTANVIALSAAANKRQDDLRDLHGRLIGEQIQRLEQMVVHTQELLRLQTAHAQELRRAESERIDAIRRVDASAVSTAADRALSAIQTLAATTTANADTLRAMVASTATTIATQTQVSMGTVNDRITKLEQSHYEGAGRGSGLHAGWGYLIGGIGLVSAILALLK